CAVEGRLRGGGLRRRDCNSENRERRKGWSGEAGEAGHGSLQVRKPVWKRGEVDVVSVESCLCFVLFTQVLVHLCGPFRPDLPDISSREWELRFKQPWVRRRLPA